MLMCCLKLRFARLIVWLSSCVCVCIAYVSLMCLHVLLSCLVVVMCVVFVLCVFGYVVVFRSALHLVLFVICMYSIYSM